MECINEPVWKAARRKRLLDNGLNIFSERGIESVKIDEIAKESGMTRATVYNYFPSKLDFVIEIGAAKWEEYFTDNTYKRSDEEIEAFTAAEYFEYYLDCFIDLYRNHRPLLRFNHFFNIYIKGQ